MSRRPRRAMGPDLADSGRSGDSIHFRAQQSRSIASAKEYILSPHILLRLCALALIAAAGPGCSPGRPAAPPLLELVLSRAGPTACRVTVAARSFDLPRDEAALTAALRALAHPPDRTTVIVARDPQIVYRCVGGAIYIAQRAGLTRVGFLSEPSPER